MIRRCLETIKIRTRFGTRPRAAVVALLFFAVLTWGSATFGASPEQYFPVYKTDFGSGVGALLVQAGYGSMTVVRALGKPSMKVVKFEMNRNDDFSRVCNGSPRTELNFSPVCKFQRSKEYNIRLSTFIPADYQFDSQQPEIISSIHQSLNSGSPPWCLILNNDQYLTRVQNQVNTLKNTNVGDASLDRGKWVNWMLQYKPDSTGATSITKLYKDGKLVFDAKGQPNAYPLDDNAYLKIGIYKWWWKERLTDVSSRTMYYGDVTILARKPTAALGAVQR